MDGEQTERECLNCGGRFMAKDLLVDGQVMFAKKHCEPCCANWEAEAAAKEKREAMERREKKWETICPPLYQKTDLSHPGLAREAVEFVANWRDEDDGVGLSIRGTSGRGKTRLAFVLGKRLHMDGSSVEAITATRLAQLCVDSYDDSDRVKNGAREKLRSIRSCRYLILDDLGKQKFTDRAETELYDLIETRTSHLRPTIWTANMSSDDFAQMMSEDRGVPIIRRLSEFSTVLSV